MYADENDGNIVFGMTSDKNTPQWRSSKPWTYYRGARQMEQKYQDIRDGALWPYTENVEAYHCPGDKRSNRRKF